MKKTQLRTRTVKALNALAQKMGIKRPSSVRKDDLIDEIIMAQKILDKKKASSRKSASSKESSKKTGSLKAALLKARRSTTVKRRATSKTVEMKPVAPSATQAPEPVTLEHRYETPKHSQPHNASPYDDLGELPESYGSGRLFFAARDPKWIYAYWDYTWHQMEDMRRAARWSELKLRIHAGGDPRGPVVQEVTMNPSSRNWFVQVEHANAEYCAEFGYYNHDGHFIATAVSKPARTPSDRFSDRTDARFVTIPFHISFHDLFELVKKYFKDGEELADVLSRLQAAGFRFPFDYPRVMEEGAMDDSALAGMFDGDLVRRIRMGSEALTEWLQRRLSEETSSGLFSSSSPALGAPSLRAFWVEVNAELIIYGATDPKARVVFDGKDIELKADGSFRFQFALPDGVYRVPVSATSPDGVETREIHLEFVRSSSQTGGVGEARANEKLDALPKA